MLASSNRCAVFRLLCVNCVEGACGIESYIHRSYLYGLHVCGVYVEHHVDYIRSNLLYRPPRLSVALSVAPLPSIRVSVRISLLNICHTKYLRNSLFCLRPLSPPKCRVVRSRNFARRRVQTMTKTSTGFYIKKESSLPKINVKSCRFNTSVTMTPTKRRKRQKFVYCIFECKNFMC